MSEKLRPCKSCGHQVSKKAATCPSCGRHNPGGGVSAQVVILTGILGAALAVFIISQAYGAAQMAGL
ncbi:hypothetical protein P0Y31_14760 [Knoellia sp. 3-2P3]|uniref:hypothetical protein n=1 Tax=unclassified Knoellia TaxID=2618719 RepID=UPI0023DB49E4|nr:hypothetical protein [Knoellia sp. 3-2P3]MDF2093612.1 hypothetical protein [Knoellia sp. 3-2P3]